MRQQPAGGFQMALHAHLHLALGTKARRVHDGVANLLTCGAGPSGHSQVPPSRPMASLAINPLGERSGISRFGSGFVLAYGNARIAVMARHALIVDRAR